MPEGYIVLEFTSTSTGAEGHCIYRHTSPMNPNALPAPLASLPKNADQYIDYDFTDESAAAETLYYRVSDFWRNTSRVSEEMSLPNPANVLSPDSPTWLFGNEEYGFANTLGIDTLYTDTAGTTPVEEYGDTIALATNLADDGPDMVQSTAAARPSFGRMPISRVRNELVATDTLSTQSVTVTAAQRTLSFRGTGTVTLSGASTAGPLEGTGTDDIVELTFTPSAGTLTLTVTGDVLDAQLELGAARTGYQSVGTGRYDVTEQGVQSVDIAYLDSADDAFEWTLDAGTYYLFIAGEKGSLFLTVTHGGGTLSVGPAAITWTGGASTVLAQAIGQRYMILPVPRDEPFTDFDKQQLVAYAMARGCPGVWEFGGNLAANGNFSSDTIWTKGEGWTIASGAASRTNTGNNSTLLQSITATQAGYIIAEFEITAISSGTIRSSLALSIVGVQRSAVGVYQDVFTAENAGTFTLRMQPSSTFAGSITNISYRQITLNTDPYP